MSPRSEEAVSASPKSGYHHGDLRTASLTAAMRMLESGEPFSLRAVSREAGVSPTALYRHFTDRDALESALAAEGLRDLFATLTEGRDLPTTAVDLGDLAVGYISLAEHFGINCEVHSMGVDPRWHRTGVGRALIEGGARRAKARGFRYLSVKTLSDKSPDPNYAKTRHFYLAMGFLPFEELPTLWGASLPCLVMVRSLDDSSFHL